MDPKLSIRQRISLGVLAWERDEFEEAIEIFDAILDDHPSFPDVHNKVGLCHAMLGDPGAALEAFDRAIEIAPTYAEAHVNRGIVLNELGRHEEARDAFDESARLDVRDGKTFPSHVGNEIAVAHAKLGDLYLVADRPADAAEQYSRALDVRPRFLDVRSKLGQALLEKGATEEARDQLELVLEEKPDFWSARLRLGIALHKLGDDEGAIREWERVAEEAPGDMRPKAYIASVRGAS